MCLHILSYMLRGILWFYNGGHKRLHVTIRTMKRRLERFNPRHLIALYPASVRRGT